MTRDVNFTRRTSLPICDSEVNIGHERVSVHVLDSLADCVLSELPFTHIVTRACCSHFQMDVEGENSLWFESKAIF